MSVIKAFSAGFRRVTSAPFLLVTLYLLTLFFAIPVSLVLHDSMELNLGVNSTAHQMADSVWPGGFTSKTDSIERPFGTHSVGITVVLYSLNALIGNLVSNPEISAVVISYLLIWSFLTGGIIDCLARQQPFRNAKFFFACGFYFFRFVRLAAIFGFIYWILFTPVRQWLFQDLYNWATRELIVDQLAFLLRPALYVLFTSLLLSFNLLFHYAKVRAVVEDRRSAIGALLAAWRFIRRQPRETIGLFLINVSVFAIIVMLFSSVISNVWTLASGMWTGFIAGQIYLVARLFSRLLFYACETSYFQSQLAHASYIAAPAPKWPDSPSADAIARS